MDNGFVHVALINSNVSDWRNRYVADPSAVGKYKHKNYITTEPD